MKSRNKNKTFEKLSPKGKANLKLKTRVLQLTITTQSIECGKEPNGRKKAGVI